MRTVITFLICLLGLSGPCSANRVKNSYHEALAEVKKDKREWGTGVSTLVIIKNELPGELVLKEQHSVLGAFFTPAGSIPAGKYISFLHTKKPWVASGSKGYVRFHYTKQDVPRGQLVRGFNVYCGWDSPWSWSLSNKAGSRAIDGQWLLNSRDMEDIMSGILVPGVGSGLSGISVDVDFMQGGTSPILKYTVRKR